MNTITLLLQQITEQLTHYYNDQRIAYNNAWYLLEHLTQKTKTELLTDNSFNLTEEQKNLLDNWVESLVHRHKPIQYIIGSVPFLNLILQVEPPVLIPRPETEAWCEQLITYLKQQNITSPKILDLCTGTGCIGLALAQAFPASTVYATDISENALQLAQKNAQKNMISNIKFKKSDLYHALQGKKFDIIVANPPYINEDAYDRLEPSVKEWEDSRALTCKELGLKNIKEIIAFAHKYLQSLNKEVCQLWIEIGYDQADTVAELFKLANFEPCILKDMQGKNRVVIGKLL